MVTITEHSTEGKNMKMKDLKNHFLLLQINDSLFPIGGYSHSYGLETYIQKGIVHNSELAAEYIRKRLLYNFLYTDFLAVRLAYDAALQEDETAIDELEDQMEASRIPSELREASRKLGSRFIKTLLHMQITPPGDFFTYTNGGRLNYLPSLCLRCSVRLHGDGSDGGSVRLSLCPDLRDGHQLRENNPFEPVGRTKNSVFPGAADGKHDSACGTDRRGNALRIYSAFDLRSMEHETLYSRLYMS